MDVKFKNIGTILFSKTKQIVLIIALFEVVIACDTPSNIIEFPEEDSLSLMAYNILRSDKSDSFVWEDRKFCQLEIIQSIDPDVIGMSEVFKDTKDFYDLMLTEYTGVGVGGGGWGRLSPPYHPEEGFYAPVYYKKDKFDLIYSYDFWHSDTPDIPGSNTWGLTKPRITTMVHLKRKVDGYEFLFLSTKLDLQSGKVKPLELIKIIILNYQTDIQKSIPAVLGGDMNLHEENENLYIGMLEWGFNFVDSYRNIHTIISPDESTIPGHGGDPSKGNRIDFVLHTDDIETEEATIHYDKCSNDKMPSDHTIVTAIVKPK